MKQKIRIRMRTVLFWAACTAAALLSGEVVQANSNNLPVKNFRMESILDHSNIISDTTKQKSKVASKKALSVLAKKSTSDCRKGECSVYAEIDKSEQLMYVYVGGELQHSLQVSTGMRGHETPNLDLRPTGPVYEKYTSSKYPEGDYKGMGNMPYAVFLRGGYAIHGTTPGSFSKLGKKASHGCIRLHPDDAQVFYNLVNSIGLENTWVTVKP